MHVSCLFVICIIIKDNDNQYNTEQSNLFQFSYMAVRIIHFKMKVGKVENEISEANNKV